VRLQEVLRCHEWHLTWREWHGEGTGHQGTNTIPWYHENHYLRSDKSRESRSLKALPGKAVRPSTLCSPLQGRIPHCSVFRYNQGALTILFAITSRSSHHSVCRGASRLLYNYLHHCVLQLSLLRLPQRDPKGYKESAPSARGTISYHCDTSTLEHQAQGYVNERTCLYSQHTRTSACLRNYLSGVSRLHALRSRVALCIPKHFISETKLQQDYHTG